MMEHMQEKLVNIFCNLYKSWWRVICSEERKKKNEKRCTKRLPNYLWK